MAKVFQLLSKLVAFGYYDESDDVRDLLPVVISYLNTEQDFLLVEDSIKSMININFQLITEFKLYSIPT